VNRATLHAIQEGVTAPSVDSATPIKGNVKAVHILAALSSLNDEISFTIKGRDTLKPILGPVTLEAGRSVFNPRELINLVAGTEVSDVYTDGIPIHDFVNFTFTGGVDGDELTVDLYLE
jgi:hypothetical protein